MNAGSRGSLVTLIGAATLVLAVADSRPAQAQSTSEPRVLVALPGFELPVALDTLGQYRDVSGSRQQIYAALLATFGSLDIPITHRDQAHGTMLNPKFVLMRRLQKQPLSKFFNCGSGLTGPNADRYRVHIAVAAFVDSTSSSARVRVAAAAGAIDVDGASKPPVTCGSTGELEEKIATMTTVYLTGSAVK